MSPSHLVDELGHNFVFLLLCKGGVDGCQCSISAECEMIRPELETSLRGRGAGGGVVKPWAGVVTRLHGRGQCGLSIAGLLPGGAPLPLSLPVPSVM